MLKKLLVTGLLIAFVQERAAFEVASIKEHPFTPGVVGVEYLAGGRMVAKMAPVDLLIMSAYGLLPSQLEFPKAVPVSTVKSFYDIEAKADPNVIPPGPLSRESRRKMQSMQQTLLAERFGLKMHTEKRELPVYALLVDKNGLKLPKAPDRDCDATPSPCRWIQIGPGSGIHGESVTLDGLAAQLSGFDRGFVNKTGVEGRFDFHLPPFSRGAATPGTLADGAPVDLNTPSLAAVLQEVGLRLESQKQLLDVYIVDHIEKPSAN
jgi:uncharacterized protein (TIGR03435 family)